MDETTLISVVMPVFNAEPFVQEAVESVLAQTHNDLELIAVDDGSTDSSLGILEGYAAHDERMRVFGTEHQGISRALNAGIDVARGRWIGRMDADDICLPHRFARQLVAAREAPHVVLWGSFARGINRRGDRVHLIALGPTTEEEFLRLRREQQNIFALHPTWLVRRDVLIEAGGYDSRFDGLEDFELLMRIADHGSVRIIPEELLLYRLHPADTSTTHVVQQQQLVEFLSARMRARRQGRDIDLDSYLAERQQRPFLQRRMESLGNLGRVHYRNATLHAVEGHYWSAAASAARAMILNPRHTVGRLTDRLAQTLRSSHSANRPDKRSE